jgi:hypothetical protein
VEHPAAERHGPLPLVCYAFAADVAGYPRNWWPPPSAPAHPGAEARRRHPRLIVSLGNLSTVPGGAR